MTVSSSRTPPSDFEVAQEADVVASKPVSLVLIGGVVVTVLSVIATDVLLSFARSALASHAAARPAVAPRRIARIHQTLIARDRHGWELRDEQRRSLDHYRWIAGDKTYAQIPIARAMQLVARGAGTPKDPP